MSQLVHVDAALDELGLELEDFKEFLGDLQEFLDESLPDLEKAISSRNYPEVRENAHSIKGAVANLRFVAAAEIAYTLEKKGLNSIEDGLDAGFEDLKKCLKESYEELKAL